MRRRILIQNALTTLAAGAVGALPALDVIRRGLVSSVTGKDAADLDADDWAEVAWEYGRSYVTDQPDTLVLNLAPDLADLQLDVDATPDGAIKRDLSRSSSLLAAIMAMSLVNLGQFQPARRWWRDARRMADASTDPAVRVWVRSQDAVHALYDRRSLSAALDRADQALAISGASTYPGTAEALGGRAQALALMGRAEEAREAVHHLSDAFAELPGNVTQGLTTPYDWPEHRLWHTASYVHTHIGDTTEARAAQERALALYPSTLRRPQALVQLHAAKCLVHDGDLDGGATHAQQVIDALQPPLRTALVLNLGQGVVDAVPVPERRRSSVSGLRDVLTLSAGQATE